MRTFDSIGTGKCIVCGTSDNGKVILVGKDGTSNDGIEEAAPLHVDCIRLRYSPNAYALYQAIRQP